MQIVRFFVVSCMLIIGHFDYVQSQTIGLLFSSENVSDGYTLFSPEENHNVYLINNCGEKINEWSFSEKPGATCYLLENGNLLRAGKDSLEIRDWDNNLLWSYAMNLNGLNQHHDIEPLPNGNILCLVGDLYSKAEIIAEGRDTTYVAANFKLVKIVELKPIGTNDASIDWEWSFVDHLIQDFDSAKSNYGVVEDHPELVDLNFDNNETNDYLHVNAIDYNPLLDQIIITSRHLSELYIIDHSTTTEEAAGHSGGDSNLGGDILWRWGNSQVYRQGDALNQKIFFPHDAKWVELGYVDEGKITVFNNGGELTNSISSIGLITPEISNGSYSKENNQFLPTEFEWSWSGSVLGNTVSESKKSGTHSLPNGNFVFCETSLGQVSEITKNGEHLWTYRNPTGPIIYNQFDDAQTIENPIFRAEKYPENYLGFFDKDLSPQGIIEDQNTISDDCTTAGIDDLKIEKLAIVNPIENGRIEFSKNILSGSITICDINGRSVYWKEFFNGNSIEVDLIPGMYLLQLIYDKKIEKHKIIIP